ncbi:MAG TPA: glycosyltransferase [Tepidisphaeraceae bacterium]|nr:glycosyltransferase [Tepidisphaeraceae bacterium]
MNVLLVPIGSHGDVHPFIGIGLALRARGHRVRVIVNPFFGSLVQQAGLDLIPIGVAADYMRLAGNPDLWKSTKGFRIVLAGVGHFLRPVYHAIVANHVEADTVVVASTLALGARIADEHRHIPAVTVHLQPSVLRSYTDPSKLPGMWTGPRVPGWAMKAQWALIDRLIVDPAAMPMLNAFRGELGLAPVTGILRDYIHSPRRVIGMWPEWFAPTQKDWPAQVRLAGFPLYDESGLCMFSPDLAEFLQAGSPPIAFTFGSAMWHAHALLEQSARACALLGSRGLLLTRHREHVPSRLPAGVKHIDFAPFGELLPHCRALVHHGGIGTASQGMKAGLPQMVLPHAHDQLDNATRMGRLGVARTLDPRRYTSDRIATTLASLLGSASVNERCREVAGKFAGARPLEQACELIEAARRGET